MLYFLNPIMRFSSLQINPVRELRELCQFYNWDLQFLPLRKNKRFIIEAKVKTEIDGKSCCWSASATYSNKKAAKRMAAQQIFANLKAQGFRTSSKSLEEVLRETPKGDPVLIGYDEDPIYVVSPIASGLEKLSLEDPSSSGITVPCVESHPFSPIASGLEKLSVEDPSSSGTTVPCVESRPSGMRYRKFKGMKKSSPSNGHKLQPNHLMGNENSVDMKTSGGSHQRSAKSRLLEICTANCWKPPVFECCDEKGPSHLKLFTYKVVLEMDETDVIVECQGEPHPKKKAAAEHAAEGALWFLKMEGYISDCD